MSFHLFTFLSFLFLPACFDTNIKPRDYTRPFHHELKRLENVREDSTVGDHHETGNGQKKELLNEVVNSNWFFEL